MTPYQFLIMTLAVTAAAVTANLLYRRARRGALSALARDWGMQYSPGDAFQLAPRLAPFLPRPGAADVAVCDVIYGIEDDFHRYIFTVEYTVGVIRAKHRVTHVATFREPKARSDATSRSPLEVAPQELPLVDQYRTLHQPHASADTEAARST